MIIALLWLNRIIKHEKRSVAGGKSRPSDGAIWLAHEQLGF